MSHFEEIDLLFLKLLEALKAILSKAECGEIASFTQVGEYGLALETAVGVFFEERTRFSSGDFTLNKSQ